MSETVIKKNSEEVRNLLLHVINNNKYLLSLNKQPIAMEIVGDAGLGKTSLCKQVADEAGLEFIKLTLSYFDDKGDLVGMPLREFKVANGEENVWVNQFELDAFISSGYKPTGVTRTTCATPEWIADRKNPVMLVLDDYTRADTRFLQGVMELSETQKYAGWSLPEGSMVVLTSNPDDGNYLVNEQDDAMRTRFISTTIKFDVDCWAKWAEKSNVDSRCINFLLMNPEVIKGKCNPRSLCKFFDVISSIKNMRDLDNLTLIKDLGAASVGEDVSSVFVDFINNDLDKLPTVQYMLNDNYEDVVNNMRKLFYPVKGQYRADIASVLASRIINNTIINIDKVNDAIIKRIVHLCTEKELFTNDISTNIIRELYKNNGDKFEVFLDYPQLVKMISSVK